MKTISYCVDIFKAHVVINFKGDLQPEQSTYRKSSSVKFIHKAKKVWQFESFPPEVFVVAKYPFDFECFWCRALQAFDFIDLILAEKARSARTYPVVLPDSF